MNKLLYGSLLLLLGMLLLAKSVWGQTLTSDQHTISGIVTDNTDNQPLPGVNILVKGTSTGASTDANGTFELTVPSLRDTLVVSFVGYQTQEVPINGRTEIDIGLRPQAISGEELVVIGYGETRQEDLTGSISQVESQELSEKNVENIGQALRGEVAGAQVIQKGGGVPGGRPSIRIRGTNSINTDSEPLFVVDGVAGVSNPLSALNPKDIESLNVLKGPSATAIYGARGANGVVIVETKRGREGPVEVNYNGSVTTGFLNRHVYTLTPDQIMYVYKQSFANGDKFGGTNRMFDFDATTSAGGDTWDDLTHLFQPVGQGDYFLDLLGADGNYYEPRFYSDWEDKMYNRSLSTNQYLRVSGGDENAAYSLSLGYNKEEGLMNKSYAERYNGKVTADIGVFDWLDVNSQIGFARRDKSNDEGLTRNIVEVWSLLPTRYPNDETYGGFAGRFSSSSDFPIGEGFWNNPQFIRDQNEGIRRYNKVDGVVSLNADLSSNFNFRSNFGIDYNSPSDKEFSGLFYGDLGEATIESGDNLYWQTESYLTYEDSFNENHDVRAQVGISYSVNENNSSTASVQGFSTNFYKWNNLGAAANRPNVNSSSIQNKLNSYFMRLNYDYKDKYLLTVTGRYDGSSKFGENNKFGFFPSVALGWNLSEENFVDNIDLISFLKIRVEAGITGNEAIGTYVTQGFVGEAPIVMGGGTIAGRYPTTIANNDLKWEETTQYGVGLDLGLWEDRISFTADYYFKDTNDMLLEVPLPRSTTPGSVIDNFGSVENKGFEFTLNTQNVQSSSFTWQSTVTAATNRNKIIKLGPGGAPIYGNLSVGRGAYVLREGDPIGSFWGVNRLGTYSTREASLAARYGLKPGDLKFEDKNQDGTIDLVDDGQIIGNGYPDWTIDIGNRFSYRNFDASVDFTIVAGVEKASMYESGEDRQLVSGGLNSVLRAWRPDHQDTPVAQMRAGSAGAYYQSYPDSHTISDGSYIRGSNAILGYSLPQDLVGDLLGLRRLRVYLQASNFLLITDAAGYDPVGSSLGGLEQQSLVPNIDKYQYPRPVRITFGIDIDI